jgi:peptidase E
MRIFLFNFVVWLIVLLEETNGFNYILLSRYSGVRSNHFDQLIDEFMGERPREERILVYVPTASYAPSSTSTRSSGEQRRRNRYDARQKMNEVKDGLGMESARLLEIDNPDYLAPGKIAEALDGAAIVYVDGGNTFYLQYHLLQTSFFEILKPFCMDGLLYVYKQTLPFHSSSAFCANAHKVLYFYHHWL